MPAVQKQYSGTAMITGTDSTYTLIMGNDWVLSRCILSFQVSSDASTYVEAALVTGKLYVTGSTMYVQFDRNSSGVYTTATINYQIVQLDTANVQTGEVAFADADLTKTVALSSVDLQKTFVLVTTRSSISSAAVPQIMFMAEINSATQLTLSRGLAGSGTTTTTVRYQVVTLSDVKTIQKLTGGLTNSSSISFDIPITSVDSTKSICFASYKSNSTVSMRNMRSAHFTSATNMRLSSFVTLPSGTMNYCVYVVEFNSGKVSRGYSAIASTDTSTTVNIGATIVPSNALSFLQGQGGYMCEANTTGSNSGDFLYRISSMTATQIVFTRGRGSIAGSVSWEIMEFSSATVKKNWPHIYKQLINN